MLRALKSELSVREGIACLDGVPFSGLVFDVDDSSEAVRISFSDVTLSCQPVRVVESFNGGKRGGEFAPLDIERRYMHCSLITHDEFPDFAQDVPAEVEGKDNFNGIIYRPLRQRGWGARMYTAGDEQVRLWWHPNGVLGLAALINYPVNEEFSWFQDGRWKTCRISPLDLANVGFSMEFNSDGCLKQLLLHRWEDAVRDQRRKTAFQCIDRFEELYKFPITRHFSLNVDDEFIHRIEEIKNVGFLDDAEIIWWVGDICCERLVDLFIFLSGKNLKKVIFGSYKSTVGDFVSSIKGRLPQLEIVSVALNSQNLKKKQ